MERYFASQSACEVGWIVFPRYDLEQGIRSRRLGPAEALLGLLGPLATVPRDIDARKVEALVVWLSDRVTVELVYGKLKDGLSQLWTICGTARVV